MLLSLVVSILHGDEIRDDRRSPQYADQQQVLHGFPFSQRPIRANSSLQHSGPCVLRMPAIQPEQPGIFSDSLPVI